MQIEIRCPACSGRGLIDVPENIVQQSSRGVAAINIAEGEICQHSFVAYVDKNLAVRDCFIADFKIELPQVELEQDFEVPDLDEIDVDIIKLNVPALTLTYIIKAYIYKKDFMFLFDGEFLFNQLENFFKFISQDSFETNMVIQNHDFYKKNKKHFKNYIVLDNENVLNDKQKILDPKKIKIERKIIQKFLAEPNPKSSLIIIKNDLQKANELSKALNEYLNSSDAKTKLTPKLLNNFLEDKYNQTIDEEYLRFLLGIVQNYFGFNFSKILSFNELIQWAWYLK